MTRRTTNLVEGWNNAINQLVGTSHPNISTIVDRLRVEDASKGIELKHLMEHGVSHRRPRQKDIEYNAFLIDLWALLQGEGDTEVDLMDVLFQIASY